MLQKAAAGCMAVTALEVSREANTADERGHTSAACAVVVSGCLDDDANRWQVRRCIRRASHTLLDPRRPAIQTMSVGWRTVTRLQLGCRHGRGARCWTVARLGVSRETIRASLR
jgi:hypothetical protein